MKAIITVVGRDTVGILAKVSAVCSDNNANIIDVTQSVLKDIFTMVMLVDISDLVSDFTDLQNALYALGDKIGMKIHVMHEDIFNSMHHI
ncbi:MAG: ACT domain-containing protein [Clostridia bacterium]|nr:ACT domain-containing protein [Clostridia bacterium]